jgi:hypothetical protein
MGAQASVSEVVPIWVLRSKIRSSKETKGHSCNLGAMLPEQDLSYNNAAPKDARVMVAQDPLM